MTALVLVAAGLMVSSLPAVARPLGRRISSAEWAQLNLIAMVGSVMVVEAGFVLLASTTVLGALSFGAVASACEELIGPLTPLGPVGGWLAAALAAMTPALAWRAGHRTHAQMSRLEIEPYLGHHRARQDHDLVILPTSWHIAYSIDVGHRQVVISEGLVRCLEPSQLRAVIGHEVAHLRHGHGQMLRMATALRGALPWWPPLAHSHRVLRASVERWADDESTHGDHAARRCLGDALRRMAAVETPPSLAAFSPAEATAERIAAMHEHPPASVVARVAVYVPGLVLAGVTVGAFGAWLGEARALVAVAGRCPI
jgi:uncharacterized protein YjeT (DUF2065 family)